uniref:Crystallin, gamma S3 n=1 Tax=Paramormyrops kingsleyae TaxID=1676925 RepID=A0A3B3SA17_9TELE
HSHTLSHAVRGTKLIGTCPAHAFNPAQIIFYEDQNFHGRCDCTDLQAHFSRCNSIHMDRGFWVLYEQPNYTGSQYVLTHGKYPDYQRWMGFNDSVRSCRLVRNVIPARPGSASMNVPTLWARFWSQHEVHSCKVLDGAWILHDQPKYRGHQCLDWNATHPSVGFLRCIEEY